MARVTGKSDGPHCHHCHSFILTNKTRGGFAEEVKDQDVRFTNTRRRSNSITASHHFTEFKTKFDVNEAEPVFEEHLHGPLEEEEEDEDHADNLSKTDSSESGHSN